MLLIFRARDDGIETGNCHHVNSSLNPFHPHAYHLFPVIARLFVSAAAQTTKKWTATAYNSVQVPLKEACSSCTFKTWVSGKGTASGEFTATEGDQVSTWTFSKANVQAPYVVTRKAEVAATMAIPQATLTPTSIEIDTKPASAAHEVALPAPAAPVEKALVTVETKTMTAPAKASTPTEIPAMKASSPASTVSEQTSTPVYAVEPAKLSFFIGASIASYSVTAHGEHETYSTGGYVISDDSAIPTVRRYSATAGVMYPIIKGVRALGTASFGWIRTSGDVVIDGDAYTDGQSFGGTTWSLGTGGQVDIFQTGKTQFYATAGLNFRSTTVKFETPWSDEAEKVKASGLRPVYGIGATIGQFQAEISHGDGFSGTVRFRF